MPCAHLHIYHTVSLSLMSFNLPINDVEEETRLVHDTLLNRNLKAIGVHTK